jgi:hypothetical protein
MAGTVGGGRDFDVREGSPGSLVELVFDACVGNLNLSVDHRKLDLVGDLLADVLQVALGIGFSLLIDRSVDLGFQLEVEGDARICAAELLDPGCLFQIGAVDLGVMLDLAPFDQASVNFLIRAELTTVPDKGSAGSGEGDDLDMLDFLEASVSAGVDEVGRDQALVSQKLKIAGELPLLSAINGFAEVAHRDDPKPSDFAQQSHLFGPELKTKVERREPVSSDSRVNFSLPFRGELPLPFGPGPIRLPLSSELGNVEWAFVGCLFSHDLAPEFERGGRQSWGRTRRAGSLARAVLRIALPASVRNIVANAKVEAHGRYEIGPAIRDRSQRPVGQSKILRAPFDTWRL